MSEHFVAHATFVIDRHYDAVPERVFEAWADPQIKARWFGGAEPGSANYTLDFRVGGSELAKGAFEEGGPVYKAEATYIDIVPNARIVYAYEMHMDAVRISVSLGTVEIEADGTGSRLTYTEQGAFLDGYDTPELREEGTRSLLDALGAEVAS